MFDSERESFGTDRKAGNLLSKIEAALDGSY
jgi:hypothetical protein